MFVLYAFLVFIVERVSVLHETNPYLLLLIPPCFISCAFVCQLNLAAGENVYGNMSGCSALPLCFLLWL